MFNVSVEPGFEVRFDSRTLSPRLRKRVREQLVLGYTKADRGEAAAVARFFWGGASGNFGWNAMPSIGTATARAQIPDCISDDTRTQIEVLKKLNAPSSHSGSSNVWGHRGYRTGDGPQRGAAESIVRVLVQDPYFVELRARAVEEFDKQLTYVKVHGVKGWRAL